MMLWLTTLLTLDARADQKLTLDQMKARIVAVSPTPTPSVAPSPRPSASPKPVVVTGDLTPEKALLAIYGNYSAKSKSSSVPNEQGTWNMGDEPEGVEAFNELFRKYKEEGKEKAVLVARLNRMVYSSEDSIYTSAEPQEKSSPEDCHACAPYLSVFLFTKGAKNWELSMRNDWWQQKGGYGNAPGFGLIGLGPDKHGLVMMVTGMNSGWSSSGNEYYSLAPQGFLGLLVSIGTSERSGCEEGLCEDDYSSDIRFLKSVTAGYYDIEVNESRRPRARARGAEFRIPPAGRQGAGRTPCTLLEDFLPRRGSA